MIQVKDKNGTVHIIDGIGVDQIMELLPLQETLGDVIHFHARHTKIWLPLGEVDFERIEMVPPDIALRLMSEPG